MRILGIDPGLHVTGYGLLDETNGQVSVVEIGVIRTNTSEPTAMRLKTIAADLEEIITQLKPEMMAIEELYSHYNHPKTAIIMGHARGVIFLKAAEAGLEVVSYSATRIKNAITGHGRARTGQVQATIRAMLGVTDIPEPADAADAVAVALCHIQARDHQVAVPSSQRGSR